MNLQHALPTGPLHTIFPLAPQTCITPHPTHPPRQGAESSYSLTEARLGGALTRHDLSIVQLGAATQTRLASFLLASQAQLHDLHSKLTLDHPAGQADQLHKCEWDGCSASGRATPGLSPSRAGRRVGGRPSSPN